MESRLKILTEDKMQVYNSSAILKAFDRVDCDEIKGAKPALKAILCSVWLNPFISFRQIELVKRVALNTGFFIAELQSLLSAMSLAAWKKRAWATLTSQPRRIADAPRNDKQACRVTLEIGSLNERLTICIVHPQ